MAEFQPSAVRALELSNIVLLGDAAATAHFSVGSGSKLAMESAIALANYIHSEPNLESAFRRYEEERRLEVLRCKTPRATQPNGSRKSNAIFHLNPVQFNYSFRPDRSASAMKICASAIRPGSRRRKVVRATGDRPPSQRGPPAHVRSVPRARARARQPRLRLADGAISGGRRHAQRLAFVHYAERAKGGAGMVFTEMTCVSPQGRISPGCTGLYNDDARTRLEEAGRLRACRTEAKIAIQLGHSGPKGSTQLGWETPDAPLARRAIGKPSAPLCVAWSKKTRRRAK